VPGMQEAWCTSHLPGVCTLFVHHPLPSLRQQAFVEDPPCASHFPSYLLGKISPTKESPSQLRRETGNFMLHYGWTRIMGWERKSLWSKIKISIKADFWDQVSYGNHKCSQRQTSCVEAHLESECIGFQVYGRIK
jgi:hypothetical protein